MKFDNHVTLLETAYVNCKNSKKLLSITNITFYIFKHTRIGLEIF